MFSPSKLERFKVSKEELAKLGTEFFNEAMPLLEDIYAATYWIILQKKSSKKIVKQVFSEAIEFCNVTKNQADWQRWIYRIWMREINEYFDKKENDTQTNFEFIDYTSIESDEELSQYLNNFSLGKLLEKLPAVFRIPLIMKEILQFKYEKIGELIDIPDGVVATRIYRARKLAYLFYNDRFDYSSEKQNWSGKKSTKKIFELRESAIIVDAESPQNKMPSSTMSSDDNSQLISEINLQKEIKRFVQSSRRNNFSIDRLKSKIEQKAKKRFNQL